MEKMTDNEIIKALHRCLLGEGCCDCALYTQENCRLCLVQGVKILINRQKAEIDSLAKEKLGLEYDLQLAKEELLCIIESQQAEIERLTNRNFELSEKGEKVCIALKTSKSEAYKEFAERLKAIYILPKYRVLRSEDIETYIDNLLTELTERKEDGE